jgi:hypothetical protein
VFLLQLVQRYRPLRPLNTGLLTSLPAPFVPFIGVRGHAGSFDDFLFGSRSMLSLPAGTSRRSHPNLTVDALLDIASSTACYILASPVSFSALAHTPNFPHLSLFFGLREGCKGTVGALPPVMN